MNTKPAPLTATQASKMLDISIHQLYRLITAGKIPALNVGAGDKKSWRVKKSDIQAFIVENSNSAIAQKEE